jgi:hypothetical protein
VDVQAQQLREAITSGWRNRADKVISSTDAC